MMIECNKVLDIRRHGEKPEVTLKDAMARTVASVEGSAAESYQYCMKGSWGWASPSKTDGICPPGSHLPPLTDDDLDDHRLARQDEGMTPNTINVELRILKRVNDYCRKRALLRKPLEGFIS